MAKNAEASKMKLYWGSGSVPCWKPMIVLEEKGLQGYDSVMVSFSKKEHKGEDVLKLNPRGQVPTFRDGDVVVNESSAICDYLEFTYGNQGHRLLPVDPAERAKVLQRVHESQNLVRTLLEGIVYYYFRTSEKDWDESHITKKKEEATEELKRWEDYLAKQEEGSYVVGKDFTMADVFVFPVLAFAVRSQLKLEKSFPCLHKYYQKVAERPSVKATWPPHWAGSEGKEMFNGV